jgi:hypothetical protein
MRNQIRIVLLAVTVCSSASTLVAQWTRMNADAGRYVTSFVVMDSHLYAGTHGNGVLRFRESDTSWTPVNVGLTSTFVNALAVYDTNLIAVTTSGVFGSQDGGEMWIDVSSNLSGSFVYAVAANNTSIFAGLFSRGVYRSTDAAGSWNPVNQGLADTNVRSLAFSGANLLAGTSGQGVFISTNGGDNWSGVLPNISVLCIAASGASIVVGTIVDGAYFSSNGGLNWSPMSSDGLTSSLFQAVAVRPDLSGRLDVFGGTRKGVLYNYNNGPIWTVANTGLSDTSNTSISALVVYGSYAFAGVYDGSMWRRPLTEIISLSGFEPSKERPASYVLLQNYPNPFNPRTTIKYELPKSSQVRLSVFDILGREVLLLVNERRNAGVYEVKFDGSNLASGVYFYRLQAGDFTQTKRLLLLK